MESVRLWSILGATVIATMSGPSVAIAGVTFVPDEWVARYVQTWARADGVEDDDDALPPSAFGTWSPSILSSATSAVSSATATGGQFSEANSIHVTGSGQINVIQVGTGTSSGRTETRFHFKITGCEKVALTAQITPGNTGYGQLAFEDFDPVNWTVKESETIYEAMVYANSGSVQVNRPVNLSDGDSIIMGRSESQTAPGIGFWNSPGYQYNLAFNGSCLVALITQQPQSAAFAAGSTASLSVGAASASAAAATSANAAANLTYQWTRAGQPLTDDGRISGATAATLTIQNFGAADVGAYSVYVSDGVEEQRSSRANLSLAPALPSLGLWSLAGEIVALVATALLTSNALRRGERASV